MNATVADHERIRPEPPQTHYDGAVRIPGMGKAPNRCRGLTPVGFCEEGHTVLGRSSCGTRRCPDHWRDWAEEAVVNAVARLAAYRQAVDGAERRLSHVVASPPQDRRYSLRALWETRSEAYDVLKAAGVRGGTAVVHPYRTNDRADNLYQTAKEAGEVEEGTGRWRFLRETTDEWEDLTRYVEAEPHYHSLGVGQDIDGEEAPDGWVVKRIRTLHPFYLRKSESYEDMAAAFYYVLTHGGVQDGRQLVTYFGDVHPASFDPEEELTAAEWDRIQIEAEKAVKEWGEGEAQDGPEECPHDDCEAAVRDIVYLQDVIDDPDFEARVKGRRGGRKRWMTLRGAFLWWDDRTDRPPPHARSSRKLLREWMEERGEVLEPDPQQVSLQHSVMG